MFYDPPPRGNFFDPPLKTKPAFRYAHIIRQEHRSARGYKSVGTPPLETKSGVFCTPPPEGQQPPKSCSPPPKDQQAPKPAAPSKAKSTQFSANLKFFGVLKLNFFL